MKIDSKFTAILAAALAWLAIATRASEIPIVSDDFKSGKEQWDWHGEVGAGELALTSLTEAQYGGSQILLKPELQIGSATQDALHLRFVIAGINAGNDGIAEARMFLVPSPLENPTFADPSATPNALSLIIAANPGSEVVSVSLFKRSSSTDPGYGAKLYSATLPLDCFPLTVDWYLSQSAYKLSLDKPAQTVEGSKEESWTLEEPWKVELRYIMRIVNITGGAKSELRMSEFAASSGPIPE